MIRHERRDQVGLIVIDRGERRNALDLDHLDALHRAVGDCLGAGARALVLTGEGTAFCAGADLDCVYGEGFRVALYRALDSIRRADVPVIAAVNGPAVGAGTQLAIACDLRVAGPAAQFSIPTARNGLAVDPWTIRRLALLGGGGAARSMLLGCSTLPAQAAERAGLVDRIGDLAEALAWAADIATMAPLSLTYAKRALDALFEDQGNPPGELTRQFDGCWSSRDFAEARQARQERRKPVFQGR